MPANASKSCLSSSHGTESAAPASEAPGPTASRARSIARRRSSTAAISAAEMRAPPRFASLRSGSANDADREGSPTSKGQKAFSKPSTALRGSSITTPFLRTTGRNEVVVTRPA